MTTLETRLAELSDGLLERTTPIDATACVAAAAGTLEFTSMGKRRRIAVSAAAALLVIVASGFTVLVTRNNGNGARIMTTVPTSEPTTTAPPTSAPTASQFIAALPDCVPVDSHAGVTVGCVLNSQLNPPNGERKNPPGMPGLPVYDEHRTIVGYEVAGLGFIPLASADSPTVWARTMHCLNLLVSGALDGSPELPDCSAAVKAFGYPDPVAIAHEIAKECAQQGPNPPQPCRKP